MISKNKMVYGFMVFNTTFNNISVTSWRSVLLVEETGGPRENHRPDSIMIFVEKMFLGWLHNMNHFQTYKLTSSCLMVLYTMYGVAVIVSTRPQDKQKEHVDMANKII
jgi:hypothetical protein